MTAAVARVRGTARQVVAGGGAGDTSSPAAQASAAGDDGQLALGLGTAEDAATAHAAHDLAVPATVSLRADALQVARFEALVDQARKRGLVPSHAGRMDLVLAALERFGGGGGDTIRTERSHAPAQIIVHQCPDCAAATVTTSAGERALVPAQVAALACDAQVLRPGKPNRATIPPRERQAVLARDRHRCASPGCGATSFLEVHHRVPRAQGGSNKATNLVTLCGRCHAFAHEGAVVPAHVSAGT